MERSDDGVMSAFHPTSHSRLAAVAITSFQSSSLLFLIMDTLLLLRRNQSSSWRLRKGVFYESAIQLLRPKKMLHGRPSRLRRTHSQPCCQGPVLPPSVGRSHDFIRYVCSYRHHSPRGSHQRWDHCSKCLRSSLSHPNLTRYLPMGGSHSE